MSSTAAPYTGVDSDSDDLHAISAAEPYELMAAKTLDYDLVYAFDLQLQEAITASLALQPQSSTSAAVEKEKVPKSTDVFSDELIKLGQELSDQAISEREFRELKKDYERRFHDHQLALEIAGMPEVDWADWGGDLERPFGEGSSSVGSGEVFRVYFKGLVEEFPKGVRLGGIGVAICNSRDELLFELKKPLVIDGQSRRIAEIRALIEGLNAAIELQLQRIVYYCDYYPLFQHVTGHWTASQRKVSALLNEVTVLTKKFTYCQPSLVARHDIKFAFKLAREAIDYHVNKAAHASGSTNQKEACAICLEESDIDRIFSVDVCMHRYCFSCMKQHVEVKLLHGILPTCPHEKCKLELRIDSCKAFLTPKLVEIMTQRQVEASIPVTDKVYCPYPKCSALMSKNEALEYSKSTIVGAERSGARKCMKCNRTFCINCKVPWHNTMTCSDYMRRNPFPHEARLKNLAATNLWRQCVKCNHMIELVSGCYHMTCRCGYEFCYNCGAGWKNKKATCSCPLWDEDNILDDDSDFEDEDDDMDSDDFF